MAYTTFFVRLPLSYPFMMMMMMMTDGLDLRFCHGNGSYFPFTFEHVLVDGEESGAECVFDVASLVSCRVDDFLVSFASGVLRHVGAAVTVINGEERRLFVL